MNLYKTIRGVIDGAGNYFFRKPDIEAIFQERLAICKTCPLVKVTEGPDGPVNYVCSTENTDPETGIKGCGCDIDIKGRSFFEPQPCPLKRWEEVHKEKIGQKKDSKEPEVFTSKEGDFTISI